MRREKFWATDAAAEFFGGGQGLTGARVGGRREADRQCVLECGLSSVGRLPRADDRAAADLDVSDGFLWEWVRAGRKLSAQAEEAMAARRQERAVSCVGVSQDEKGE